MMLYIVGISGVVYLLLLTMQPSPQAAFQAALLFSPEHILRGQVWRLVTWIFLPTRALGGTGIIFTLIMLYFYYFIGSTLEREWGTGIFNIYYIFGVLLHVIYGFIVYFAFDRAFIYIDTVYLNLSMFFAYAVLNPDHMIRLFMIIPIKMKWAALANAVFFLFSLISGLIARNFIGAFLPLVALLNFVLMCGDDLISYLRPMLQSAKRKTSPNVINFKKEAKRAKREMEGKPYRHKCAVCGKTDTEFPEMDFRYCSKCAGYHCFCIEHINSHIHFDR